MYILRQNFLFVFLFSCSSLFAQKNVTSKIDQLVNKTVAEAHLSFLASDEMRGRNTGSPEIDIAANYLAAQFKLLGVKPVPGAVNGYFQPVDLKEIKAPTVVEFIIGSDTFKLSEDLLFVSGGSTKLENEVVFAGYGSSEDFEKTDVKGKIVVTYAGTRTTANAVQAMLTDSPQKNQLAYAKGASALIEIMAVPGVPWQGIAKFISGDRMITNREGTDSFPHLFMKNTEATSIQTLLNTKKSSGTLSIIATPNKVIKAKNVIGIIEGTDAVLKNEYIVLTAHYDHVGVKKNSSPDSIYNGARDDAIGTVALLQTANFLSKNPPKRSVILLAVTGEEKGLLGSEWYANHPLIPLNKTVFNLNCDGAGYNDKTIVSIFDFNRTTVDEWVNKACQAYGLIPKGDPAPEQNLYERSDNVNFAVKGVPAMNFAPGVKAFDQELFTYYHQPADEVSSLDMDYLQQYYRSFVYTAYLIANAAQRPVWKSGDRFAEAGKTLYGK